jgi:hypothetical protein
MEKQFILIQNNQVVNVTVGNSLGEVQGHFPDYEVEEFIDRDTVVNKYGYSRFFQEIPAVVPQEPTFVLD